MKRLLLLAALMLPIVGFSQQETTKIPITVTALGDGLHRLFVNNSVSVVSFSGDDGLLIIDTGYERTVSSLSEKLKEVSDKPLRYIVNTHIHGDHTGGNQVLGKGVDIIAHENVKEYLSHEKEQDGKVTPAFPLFAQPNITFTERMTLDFNGQQLKMVYLPGGHTSGDIVIYFPASKVLVVGDLLFANYFPYVDVGNGGNPLQYLKNIEWIVNNFPKDVTVVGGHGPIYTMAEYNRYGETINTTVELLKKHKRDGMTLEQMKEGKVLNEWATFGSFFITEDRWIDIVFPFI